MSGRALRYGDGIWTPGSILTNPADATVLVDTGPIATQNEYLFACTGAGSVAWVYDIQHRDAANAVTLHSQRRRPGAGNDDFLFPNLIPILAGERIRLVLVGAVTGEIQHSIIWIQVQ